MTQLGNTSPPTAGYISRGDGTNQVWSTFTMPAGGGMVTTIHAYFSTFTGGTATCKLCVWDSGGNLLGSVDVSVPQLSSGAGAQQWNAANPTPFYVPAGNCSIGFWTPSGNGFNTSSEVGGASSMKVAGSSPSNLSGSSSTGIGALGAYIDYTPGGIIRVNTGTPASPVWTTTQLKINTGTAASPVWTFARLRVNQGTPAAPNWVDAT